MATAAWPRHHVTSAGGRVTLMVAAPGRSPSEVEEAVQGDERRPQPSDVEEAV